ncbi:MAG: filamentous hemagglutinin N-terminal domain-containing protein, partial [Verrucomicrobia bacterium]|nr:filamentous hemagglutinin N-terminal domain-containing protein [Verrucomicrobiota bacterium]
MPSILKKFFCLVPFLAIAPLFSLPEKETVTTGQADFHSSDKNSLQITASDKTIINYQKFNIAEGEHVQFIQPSASASVLNRVTSKDPSKILGQLSSNGRVFLINPNGICFGPNSIINTGSFLASTLNILDEDFLKDRFHFFQEPGSEKATITNEGMISASPEGFVTILAPFIENRGSISARAGKVVLAAAERVTLDFSGDGLIQFTIDGDLKQALIENYGSIEAASGSVELSLRTAKDAIKMVVNTDGITPVNAIEESEGLIRLVSNSHITANKVHIEGNKGSNIEVQGTIDVSNSKPLEKGGSLYILGEHIKLVGAQIDASGDIGGTVLIGGDYQGKGPLYTAQNTLMDNTSIIHADSTHSGNGGKVILWADDTTLFDGKIFARGGPNGGNGGFVETSGEITLGIHEGFVNTSAPLGKFGDWLLDPASIVVATGGGGTLAQAANCGTNGTITIAPATIAASVTNVILCAQRNANSTITVTNPVTMTNAGVSLTLTAGSTNLGTISLNNNLATRGGAINFNGVVVVG